MYLWLESGTAFLFGMIFTYSSLYQVTVVKLNPLQLVLVGTLLEATAFLFEIPTGVVADMYSRRLSIIIGVTLTGIAFLVEGAFPFFITVLVGQVLWGIGYTFTSGATEAWISDEIGEAAAGRAFLRAGQLSQITGLLGIGGGMGLALVRVNVPILVGGGLFLVLAFGLLVWMPETGFIPAPAGERRPWQRFGDTFRGGVGMLQRRPALYTILLVGLFLGLYSEAYDRLWVKHLTDEFLQGAVLGLDAVTWFGLLRAAGMLLSVGVVEVVRRRVPTDQPRSLLRALIFFTLLLTGALFTFAFSRLFGLVIVAYLLISVSRSATGPLYTGWVNQRLDSRVRATVLSMTSQMNALGQIASGPILGLVGNLVSVRAALVASGGLLVPIFGLYGRALRRGEMEPVSGEKEIVAPYAAHDSSTRVDPDKNS